MTRIDWDRMGKPQADGYDTLIVEAAAHWAYGFEKQPRGEHTWLGGAVNLSDKLDPPGAGIQRAGFDHPGLAVTEQYLAQWSACYAQCQRLLQTVFPFDSPSYIGARGCFCGTGARLPGRLSQEDGAPFGEVFATLFDYVGFVEGVVHEMVHWKLHALGIHFESWDEILLSNKPTETFVSSLRKDKPRPMGAVLHAHWVCLHTLAVDLAVAPIRPAEKESDASVVAAAVTRVLEGRESVNTGAVWTADGYKFWTGIQDWTRDLLLDAEVQFGVHV